ncbi:MAG: UvrB/UvrC motif-containing protein [Verrucomicrobiales bacterium]|nr:UvrB/UvrC motif-containing protein [Verrucomicrobiota bacterium JB025]
MKCDFCDKKATVFLTQLVGGKMEKVCLCDGCAKERGVTDPTGFSLAEVLLGGAPGSPGPVPAGQVAVKTGGGKTCPSCGFSLEDLQRVRRFGCSDCYRTFSAEVGQMVQGMHKGTSHAGKVPEGLMGMQVRQQRIEELREQLEQAIASESYEEAAGIRDEIQNLTEAKA